MATIRPFDYSGIKRGADGIARYLNRPPSLVHMLRATADKWPKKEGLVELGGERLDYTQLWERATRVAGGRRSLWVAELL